MNAVQTPVFLEVRLSCPNCPEVGVTVLEIRSELRISEDDEGEVRELHPTVKKKAVRHACHQRTLDDAVGKFRQTTAEMVESGDVDQVTVKHEGREVDVVTGEVISEDVE